MMARIRRAFERFGGRNLTVSFDEKLEGTTAAQNEIDRRLRALQVEVDVQARRRLHY